MIVWEGTDVEKVAITSAIRNYCNAGKVCTSPARLFVHESIYQPFVNRFVQLDKTTVVGNVDKSGLRNEPLPLYANFKILPTTFERGPSNLAAYFQPACRISPIAKKAADADPYGSGLDTSGGTSKRSDENEVAI